MEIRRIAQEQPKSKRYSITWSAEQQTYICEDKVGNVFGFGSTQLEAYQDCVIRLEIATSDIHQ